MCDHKDTLSFTEYDFETKKRIRFTVCVGCNERLIEEIEDFLTISKKEFKALSLYFMAYLSILISYSNGFTEFFF